MNPTQRDIVYLHGIKVDCVIGVWEWERKITQRLTIDLDMATDIRTAAVSDELDDTLNYKAVSKRVFEFAESSSFKLVESLAENIAGLIMDEFKVPWCRVRINKTGAVRGARDVGILIERVRED